MMKTKPEFRKVALDFAKRNGFDKFLWNAWKS